MLLPTCNPPDSNVWRTGIDEWGRVWRDGMYIRGVIDRADDLAAVRREVDRCVAQGASGGGYMLASCNSICEGMNPAAVAEMFRYQAEVV
ncbi:MAG: hypothetical protein Kow0031_40160 [Anaerolineae bacterium]